jgi:hypothetical protein
MSDMTEDPDVILTLNAALARAGRDRVLKVLSALGEARAPDENTLTIVVNEGVHHLPEEYKRGEVFVASRGSLDLSTAESIHKEFRRTLEATARILKSRPWTRVYIVPFGPAPLSMQIKLLVYKVCGIESVDVMNLSGRDRADVSIRLRDLIIEADLDQ